MSIRDRLAGIAAPDTDARLAVDRVACEGRGICSELLAPAFTSDEWGYPIVHDEHVDADLGATAIRLCPVRALRWR
ncbi:putative ferredoxin [Gordonia polyisoprenivorans VH2]|uniref:Putative ferredoxin n=1 Tax=Gordonia polyisoprenivorans (strain DSM 44266 / VH2) TaxID=1112204 RepID=H6MWR3_GORPV|nr:ferredoxin [Gordonia polyisoprenivorans]AFA75474.1 putative ferredoxin [Gordonia polyisoprenivorans VH2]OZC32393.1 ferredoxin [Gordonia polyisoprenivorans]UZF55782.1 ferredoxin [Gordonia polyisoprenivorans]